MKRNLLLLIALVCFSFTLHGQGFDDFYKKNFSILVQKSSGSINNKSFSNIGAGVSANVYFSGKGGRSIELYSPFITDLIGGGAMSHTYYTSLVHAAGGYNVIADDKNILAAGITIAMIFGDSYSGKSYFLEPGTYLRYDRLVTPFLLVRVKNSFLHPLYFSDYNLQHFSSISTLELVHRSGIFVGVNSWNMLGAPVSRLDFTAGYRLQLFNK